MSALPRIDGGAIAVAFDRAAAEGELDRLRSEGADMFELRLDMAGNPEPEEAERLAASFDGHPLIATCRREDEGGRGDDDTSRLLRLAACVPHAAAIDLELASAAILPEASVLAANSGCELIVSVHDVHSTPPLAQLQHKIDWAFEAGADICKIATTVSCEEQIETLAGVLEEERAGEDRPLAVMCMGGDQELVSAGRVRLAKAGSLFVFARAALSSAPGQPPLEWLAQQLRGDDGRGRPDPA